VKSDLQTNMYTMAVGNAQSIKPFLPINEAKHQAIDSRIFTGNPLKNEVVAAFRVGSNPTDPGCFVRNGRFQIQLLETRWRLHSVRLQTQMVNQGELQLVKIELWIPGTKTCSETLSRYQFRVTTTNQTKSLRR